MDVNARIDQFAEQELKGLKKSRTGSPSLELLQPIDLYQNKRNNEYERSKKAQSFGSPASMTMVASDIIDTLSPEYNITANQFNHLQEYDMSVEAQSMADKYMEENFIPVVMGLVDQYGADQVLANRQVIDMLDAKAFTGNGDGTGYTAAFIKTFAPEIQGTVESVSDAEVSDSISEIKDIAEDNPRAAVSMAKRLKERVDNGELSASSKDYSLIAEVSVA